MKYLFLLLLIACICTASFSQNKPKVWIYSDMSDKTIPGTNSEGTVNDPDDISAMAGYLLMCNEFNTLGIVITSTHRSEHKTSGDQAKWAAGYFGLAFSKDLPALQLNIGGYPDTVIFQQSCIKVSGEKFSNSANYTDLTKYNTVQSLLTAAQATTDTINVLCWGSLTEPAIFVKHCLVANQSELLKRIRFIAHWTNSPLHQGTPSNPEKVANCNEDGTACSYMKDCALNGKIVYYECGAIGQHGIVSGQPKGSDYYNQYYVSQVGKLFATGKYVYNGVDHSDAATYWVLLEKWGVKLSDIASNGTNNATIEQNNENKFKAQSPAIHNELLRRAKLAVLPATSVKNVLKDATVYFNLNGGSLHVDFNSVEPGCLKIYDITGKTVHYKILENKFNVINTHNLNKGFYLVEVVQSNNRITRSLSIN